MPLKVSNASSGRLSSTQRRRDFLPAFDSFGFEVMPCTRCFNKGWKYVMVKGTSQCKECFRVGSVYNGTGVLIASLERICQEHDRLETKETAAEVRLLEIRHRHQ